MLIWTPGLPRGRPRRSVRQFRAVSSVRYVGAACASRRTVRRLFRCSGVERQRREGRSCEDVSMTRFHWTVAAAAGMVLIGTASARADPITITRNSTAAVAEVGTNGSERSATQQINVPASTVTAMRASPPAIATATATSNFTDAMHWFGTGTTMALWTSQAMSSIAGVQAEFLVSSPMNYAFDVTFLSTITPCCRPFASSGGVLDLDTGIPDESGDNFLDRVFQAEDLATAAHNGVGIRQMFTGRLMPGLYDFGIGSSASSGGAFFFGPGS